jgi:hypothetical protein
MHSGVSAADLDSISDLERLLAAVGGPFGSLWFGDEFCSLVGSGEAAAVLSRSGRLVSIERFVAAREPSSGDVAVGSGAVGRGVGRGGRFQGLVLRGKKASFPTREGFLDEVAACGRGRGARCVGGCAGCLGGAVE